MTAKEFVIFRHAHRLSGGLNPELSESGLQQATQIADLVRQGVLPLPQLLLSSPKLRAKQTFTPLKKAFQIPHLIEPVLDERAGSERGPEFELRVKEFLHNDLPTRSENCIYLCTHLDWLEVFSWAAPLIDDISNDVLHLLPAHYFHFRLPSETNAPWTLLKKGGVSLS